MCIQFIILQIKFKEIGYLTKKKLLEELNGHKIRSPDDQQVLHGSPQQGSDVYKSPLYTGPKLWCPRFLVVLGVSRITE